MTRRSYFSAAQHAGKCAGRINTDSSALGNPRRRVKRRAEGARKEAVSRGRVLDRISSYFHGRIMFAFSFVTTCLPRARVYFRGRALSPAPLSLSLLTNGPPSPPSRLFRLIFINERVPALPTAPTIFARRNYTRRERRALILVFVLAAGVRAFRTFVPAVKIAGRTTTTTTNARTT